MQNNVTELTHRLLRSLDSNYNVIDIPEVVDIISHLEKVAITKELLETTRLGKHINELRRKTTNAELSRRAKELLKKWRSMVIPEANGQVKTSPPLQQHQQQALKAGQKASPPLQGPNSKPRASSLPQSKVSPPMLAQKMLSPGLPSRLLSPAMQGRLVSPSLQANRLVSPGLQAQKMVSPGLHGQLISPKLGVPAEIAPPLGGAGQLSDVNLNQVKSKKRPAKDGADGSTAKRPRLNGGLTDLDVSDSNSSFKDVILSSAKTERKRDVIVINSDSNSSFAERSGGDPFGDQQQPKRRGRKKGSKNHRNLIDEAETSFTNKLAVSASRGNSKVKTTQELLASIQNKNSVLSGSLKSKEDLEEKAAKLTERVSIINQNLNANTHRNKNSQKNKFTLSASKPNERVIESGSVINDKSLLNKLKEEEEEIVVVDDIEPESETRSESQETEIVLREEVTGARSLSVEEAMALLPPVDKSVLLEADESEPHCTCYLKENKPDFSIDEEEEVEQPPPFEFIEDPNCPARCYLSEKYRASDVSDEKLRRLQADNLPNINGNMSLGTPRPEAQTVDGLWTNVVPNIYEKLDKDVKPTDYETYKKYSVSEGDGGSLVSDDVINKDVGNSNVEGDGKKVTEDSEKSDIRTEVFREWYECVDRPSYNGDILRILPYCIVD